MEELFYILSMQGFCNKIYDNYHDIIGWDTNKGKKNVYRRTEVTADASGVGTVLGSIWGGGVRLCRVLTRLSPVVNGGK